MKPRNKSAVRGLDPAWTFARIARECPRCEVPFKDCHFTAGLDASWALRCTDVQPRSVFRRIVVSFRGGGLRASAAEAGIPRGDGDGSAARHVTADMAVLNRVSWGAETADAQSLAQTGLARYLDEQLNPPDDDGLPPDVKAQIAAMEISRKSVVEIMAETRGLQQAAQRLKGTPDYDAAQKLYQKKLSDLAREGLDIRCCAISIPSTSSRNN